MIDLFLTYLAITFGVSAVTFFVLGILSWLEDSGDEDET